MSAAVITPIDKLAREICWAGFTTKEARRGKTKVTYWKSIAEEARDGYRDDARWLFWTLKKLGHKTVADLLELHDYMRETRK